MILINGQPASKIDVGDRGFAYGDGLFETIAVVAGDVLNWQYHLTRLSAGCQRLNLPLPVPTQLLRETETVADAHARSVVKIIVTRGVGGGGYTPPDVVRTNRIVMRRDWPGGYDRNEHAGIRLCLANHRLSTNCALAGLKHLNRLDQVIASAEMVGRNVDEALMLDDNDRVIEATRCNLFIVSGDRLLTPSLDRCGVAGVMRSILLELAPMVGLVAELTNLTMADVHRADEMFLCNAIAGLWPAVALEDGAIRKFAIGSYSRRLQSALVERGHHR